MEHVRGTKVSWIKATIAFHCIKLILVGIELPHASSPPNITGLTIKLLHNFLLQDTEMVSELHIFDIWNAFTIPQRVKILH